MITKCLPKQNKTKSHLRYPEVYYVCYSFQYFVGLMKCDCVTFFFFLSSNFTLPFATQKMTYFQVQKQGIPLSLANQGQLHVHF